MPELDSKITLDDIANAVQIIDYAAREGAFKHWDNIRQILTVRDKLHAYVSEAKASLNLNTSQINLQNEEK